MNEDDCLLAFGVDLDVVDGLVIGESQEMLLEGHEERFVYL
jgi:hypothetical protein